MGYTQMRVVHPRLWYIVHLYFVAFDSPHLLWWDRTNLDNIHIAIPGLAGLIAECALLFTPGCYTTSLVQLVVGMRWKYV